MNIEPIIPEREEMRIRIGMAIRRFLNQDRWLLEIDSSERSMAHRLAVYIEMGFRGIWHVDCEYNRDHRDSKVLVEHKKILRKYKIRSKGLLRNVRKIPARITMMEYEAAISVYPDIIIHRRRSNDFNIAVIEIKKSSNPLGQSGEDFDIFKLGKFKDQLDYKYAMFVKFYTYPEVIRAEFGFIEADGKLGRRTQVLP